MKLRLRHADHYDYKTLAGEASKEVILKLTGTSKLLKVSNSYILSYNHRVKSLQICDLYLYIYAEKNVPFSCFLCEF